MTIKSVLATTILSGILGCGHPVAQESLKGAVMVFAKGTCTHFVVSGAELPMHIRNLYPLPKRSYCLASADA